MNYKLCFYVPVTHLESVKQALFAAGAGKIGNYDCCAWQVLGQGQFRPNHLAQPFLGQANQIEEVAEYKIEMICAKPYLKAAISALKQAHPYEEPAFDVLALVDIESL